MEPRRLCATFGTALLVASLPVAALAAPPTRNSGPLVDLQSAVANPTDGAWARVQAVAHGAGTTVTLHVDGLTAPAGTTLGAHVHTGPCVTDNGGAAGPHFNIDVSTGTVPAEISDRTEVWLDITATGDGIGHAVAQVPFQIPTGEAQSVVIHALPTDHVGAAGARLACLGIEL
jgi:Cu/Zn superoxide dismutase